MSSFISYSSLPKTQVQHSDHLKFSLILISLVLWSHLHGDFLFSARLIFPFICPHFQASAIPLLFNVIFAISSGLAILILIFLSNIPGSCLDVLSFTPNCAYLYCLNYLFMCQNFFCISHSTWTETNHTMQLSKYFGLFDFSNKFISVRKWDNRPWALIFLIL